LTLLLLLGWTVLSSAWFWTLSVIGIILIPPLFASLLEMFQKPGDVLLGQHLTALRRSADRHFAQAAFMLVCLPYEAFFSLDAIIRTGVRILITHKRLLEWNPSGDRVRPGRSDLVASFQAMWIAPIIALAAAIYLAFSKPGVLSVAGPILGLWFASRLSLVDQSTAHSAARLTADQTSSSIRFPRPGPSSRPSSGQKIIGYRRITIRSIPLPWSRTARRRPTWGWRSWRI
jgi:hypothetical protein